MKKKKIINSPSSPSPPVASWSEPHSHCPQTGRSSGRACCRSEAEGKQRAKSVMMKQHSWDDKPVSPTLCLVFCRLFRKIFRISSSRLLEMLGMARRRAVPRDSKFLRKEKTNGKKFNCEIERTNKQIFRKNFFFFFYILYILLDFLKFCVQYIWFLPTAFSASYIYKYISLNVHYRN